MMTIIDKKLMDELSRQASESPRLRSHKNLHTSSEDLVQRLYIGAQPGTYIRPHAHMQSHKWEYITVVRGAMDILTFDASGVLEQRLTMQAGGETSAIEMPSGTWHTLIVQEPDTILFEVKQGPYDAKANAEFAPWAPEENTPEVDEFLQRLMSLRVGEQVGRLA